MTIGTFLEQGVTEGMIDENQLVLYYGKNNDIEWFGRAGHTPIYLEYIELDRYEVIGNELRINQKVETPKNERILCAAIKIDLNGEPLIISGYRHGDCFNIIHKMCMCAEKYITQDNQGFLTSCGRFVSRKEAKIIAKQANQLIRDSEFSELISEDIY